MMNKKGQVLVVFILMLPLILTFIGLIVDIGNSMALRRKNENIIKDAVVYSFKNSDSLENINEKIDLVEKNIKNGVNNYDDLKVNLKDDILEVKLETTYDSIFSNLFNIGLNKIKLNFKYDIIEQKIVRE